MTYPSLDATSMKLISLNTESHKHLELILPFLKHEQPDVICLQEVFEVDVPTYEAALGMKGQYVPMADVTEVSIHQAHALGSWGILQLSALPRLQSGHEFYVKFPGEQLPIFFDQGNPNSMDRAVLWGTFSKNGTPFTIATTHFTWSPKGSFTDLQKQNMSDMLRILGKLPEFVFCGDLNSPRNGEPDNLFNTLAKKFTDNIPADVTTSIDGQFHKAGQIELMVDGLFSTPSYVVENVRVVNGVSDHCAVVAEIFKK